MEAYRTVHPRADPQLVQAAGGADVVTFTSASTVTGYVAVVGTDSPPPSVACIGPVTAAAARDAGFTVDIEAIDHTISGLIDAIIRHLTEARG